MPITLNKLTDADCRSAQAGEKPRRLFDGAGLYLEVLPSGGRYWRMKYRFAGKERRLALGVYPTVSLKAARAAAKEARELLAAGVDPGEAKKAKAARARASSERSLARVAREWHERQMPTWTPGHAHTVWRRLERDVFPWLGNRDVAELDAADVLDVLRRVEDRGNVETAHRIKSVLGQVFAFAIATRRASRNPAAEITGALQAVKPRHLPAVTDPKEVGALLRAIHGYSGTFVVRCAFKLAPLVFVRPGELRAARWSEFDLDAREWRIPAERMKRRIAHLVPLSEQALAILHELQAVTGSGTFVFPSARSPKRPMSNNALTAALRRMGYDRDTMTWHGFRSIATTLLNEQGWPRDAIERQLAHAEGDRVRAAYHRAEYLSERRKMMQAWADYLDGLRCGANVVNLARAAGH